MVCLIDPVGDVYACPFAIHEEFLAGNVRSKGGFHEVWKHSELFLKLRNPQNGGACNSCAFFDTCKGGCMAAKFFTGLALDGPDPECVVGYGEELLKNRKDKEREQPASSITDHSHRTTREGRPGKVSLTLSVRPGLDHPPVSACEENPLAGFAPGASSSSDPQSCGCGSGGCGTC